MRHHVIKSLRRSVTVGLKPLDSKVLDGGAKAVKAGLDPSFFDGQRLTRVGWIRLVTNTFHGRHKPAQTHVPGVSDDGFGAGIDAGLFDQGNDTFEVGWQPFFAPLGHLVGLGQKPAGVQGGSAASKLSKQGVFGQDMVGHRVGVPLKNGRRHGVPGKWMGVCGGVVLGGHGYSGSELWNWLSTHCCYPDPFRSAHHGRPLCSK